MLLKLDEETNRRLIKAKDRSRRSKTAEAYLRLKDHLERFPDFYNSELAVREVKRKSDLTS
ncbi:TraY domain-containing protein (plasmid) [Klebsiella pneumoniae]|nr:TraY domain-containing protein [Klebsiella pneumoniae]